MPRSPSAVLAAVMALAGCRIGTVSPEEFDRVYPIARLTTLAGPGRNESLDAVRDAAGGGRVRVTALTFFDDRTQITAQNPRVPSDFDLYTYWQGDVSSSAVRLHGDEEQRLVQKLFDLDSVPFDRLPELARNAYKELPISGARVSRVTVSRAGDDNLEIEISIDGERRHGRVRYDKHGTLLEAKQD